MIVIEKVSVHALKCYSANFKLGCIAFTKQYKDLDNCPACHSPRHDSNNYNRQFRYIPLKHHIKLMYAHRSTAEIIQSYRITVQNILDDDTLISDIWGAEVMQSDRMRKLFEGNDDNKWAIVLQFALDGVQIHTLRNNEVWPLICLNLNLSPCIRFCEDNILPLAITLGPNELVDIDSFLSPIVDEVQWLSKDRV